MINSLLQGTSYFKLQSHNNYLTKAKTNFGNTEKAGNQL